VSRLADRFWTEVTEERVLAFISNVRDVVVWPSQNIIMELSMDDGRHSDPYPKMPWQSGDSVGRHRTPDGDGGCLSLTLACFTLALTVVAILMGLL
jgi:hypothetical protein